MNISLTCACMDRFSMLEESLSTWIKIPFKEIIIVDWSSKISLNNLISKYQNGKIYLLRVNGKEKYNQSKASNLKVRFSTSEFVLSIDSDIKISENFLENINLDDKYFWSGSHNKSTTGTCIISRDMFNKLNGYNESMEGWGYHDIDFYNRLQNNSYIHKYIDKSNIIHIDHDDISRVSNYDIKNKIFSNAVNRRLAIKNPWGIHNKMELQEITVYYPNGKIETKII